MIDEGTQQRLDQVKMRSLHDGTNLFEAMDKAKLLRTEATINGDWANCLERLWMNLESQPIVALTQMGGGQNTPLDAVRGVLEYIDIFRKQFAAQSKE